MFDYITVGIVLIVAGLAILGLAYLGCIAIARLFHAVVVSVVVGFVCVVAFVWECWDKLRGKEEA